MERRRGDWLVARELIPHGEVWPRLLRSGERSWITAIGARNEGVGHNPSHGHMEWNIWALAYGFPFARLLAFTRCSKVPPPFNNSGKDVGNGVTYAPIVHPPTSLTLRLSSMQMYNRDAEHY